MQSVSPLFESASSVDRLLIDRLVAQLRLDGIVRLPPLVSSDQLAGMQKAFRTRLRRMRWNDVDGYEKELYRHVIQDVLTLDQGFVDIGLHPVVKAVLKSYLGDGFALVETKGWKSLATTRDFHGWHGDAWYDQTEADEIPLEVKLAFYLTDVKTGAFNYISGSHRKRHPGLVGNTEVQNMESAEVMEMTGAAGSAFLFDTSGVHRQSVPILEPREAVFYNYHDPTVPLQKESVDYYRYHPLILNAAFLGNLSQEDERILGFGNKVRFQPAHERNVKHVRLNSIFDILFGATLRVDDLSERLRARLNRLVNHQ